MRPKKLVKHRQDMRGDGRPPKVPKIKDLVTRMLTMIGENPGRNGLLKTPERVESMFRFMTQGYQQDVDELLNGALFPIDYDEMVIVKDIDFFSLCEHHLLPFFGRCHVGYLPNKRVVGLSKIPRIVVMEARHLCMMMRGVEKQNTVAVTSEMLGVFRSQQQTRDEFLKLIRRGSVGDPY
jgi:GTP cyclohydrolase I